MTQASHCSIEDLATNRVGPGTRVLRFEETDIHVQFLPASVPTETLIVRFHGAVMRQKRSLPAFQPNLRPMSPYGHQLTICDPTMMSREGFNISWYAGHDTLDVQGILRRFLERVTHVLGTRRHIYFGSSGGGFAALNFSYHHPGSVAVVLGPQTSIGAHLDHAITTYLENCWPGRTLDEVAERIDTDMCALYRGGHRNTVLYLQSAGDFLHNSNHMAPFVSAINANSTNGRDNANFLLISDYWGRPGHSNAVPQEIYVRWLHAVFAAERHGGADILESYTMTGAEGAMAYAARIQAAKQGDEAFDTDAVKMADRLRDYHLRRTGEN